MWYYEWDGAAQGPVEAAEIRRLLALGTIRPTTNVWRQGLQAWLPAGHTELFVGQLPPPMYGQQLSLYPVAYGGRQVHFAGFWIRALAMTVDWLLIHAVSFVAVVVLLALTGLGASARSFSFAAVFAVGGAVALIFMPLAYLVGVIAYFTAYTSGRWQATPGKRLMGIHVVSLSGRPMGFGGALGRWLCYFITSLVPFQIGFMLAGWTNQKRALHDMICDTRVIYGRL